MPNTYAIARGNAKRFLSFLHHSDNAQNSLNNLVLDAGAGKFKPLKLWQIVATKPLSHWVATQ
jgi:hypothetical protein